MQSLGCNTRHTERRNRDSMKYIARLQVLRNAVRRPKNVFIEVPYVASCTPCPQLASKNNSDSGLRMRAAVSRTSVSPLKVDISAG